MADPLSMVAAAVSIGKASIEGVQSVRKRLAQGKLSKDELGEIREAVQGLEAGLLESQNTVLDLKAAILQLREEKLQLREQNRELAEQLRENETRAAEKHEYKRVKVGQSLLLERADDPGVHYCPTCHAKGDTIVIQPHAMRQIARNTCPKCKALYP